MMKKKEISVLICPSTYDKESSDFARSITKMMSKVGILSNICVKGKENEEKPEYKLRTDRFKKCVQLWIRGKVH